MIHESDLGVHCEVDGMYNIIYLIASADAGRVAVISNNPMVQVENSSTYQGSDESAPQISTLNERVPTYRTFSRTSLSERPSLEVSVRASVFAFCVPHTYSCAIRWERHAAMSQTPRQASCLPRLEPESAMHHNQKWRKNDRFRYAFVMSFWEKWTSPWVVSQ